MASNNFLFLFGKAAKNKNVLLRRFGDLFAVFDYGNTVAPIQPWPLIGGGWDSGTVDGNVTANNQYDYGSVTATVNNSNGGTGTRLSWNTSVNTTYWTYTGQYEAKQSKVTAPPFTAQADSNHSRSYGEGMINGRFYIELLYTNRGQGGNHGRVNSVVAGVQSSTVFGSNINNSRSGSNYSTTLSFSSISGNTNSLTVDDTTNGIVKIFINLDNGTMGMAINNNSFTTTTMSETNLAEYRDNGATFFGEWWDGHAFEIRDPADYTYDPPDSSYVLGWGKTS